MKSKIGIVDLYADIPISWWARAKPVFAISMAHNVGYWHEVKRVSPNTLILGRHYFEEQNLALKQIYRVARKTRLANKWAKRHRSSRLLALSPQSSVDIMRPEMEATRGIYWGWMRFNEIAVWNADQAAQYANSEIVWMQAMEALSLKCGIFSWSEGHPDLALLPQLRPAFKYAIDHGHKYTRHEYDVPMWRTQPWRCLRYRLELAELERNGIQIPDGFVLGGEIGMDGGVAGVDKPQRGWREFTSAQGYMEQLQWYDGEVKKDRRYFGGAIFAWRWNLGNGTFNTVS